MHRENKKFRKIGLIMATSENEVLRFLILSDATLPIKERACAKVQKRNLILSFKNIVHHRAFNRSQYGLISKK